jgi:hypothetical protein
VRRAGAAATVLARREWTYVLGLFAVAAGLLFAAGYNVAGAIAFALCAGGYAARRRATRK